MSQLTVEEIKSESLDILKVVHNFCVEHNIRYFMDYGTLLGAVRHKGFIPWDDDIDICMPRPDYERFIKEFNVSGYYAVSYHNEKKFVLSYCKVASDKTYGIYRDGYKLDFGLSIDIFPKDGLPVEEKQIEAFYKKMENLFFKRFLRIKEYEAIRKPQGIKDFIKVIIRHFITSLHYAKLIDNAAKKYEFEKSEKVCCSVALFTKRFEIANRSSYDKSILMDFEDTQFFAPVNYHDVLVSEFGTDYMIPPPEDKRGSAHSTEYYFWR